MKTLAITFTCALAAAAASAQTMAGQTPMSSAMGMPMAPPAVGDKAKDFTLSTLDGTAVTLSAFEKRGPVVLVMLRGWVGYQCPFCNKQVGEFITRAKDFEAAGANVVFVYPGAPELVQVKAADFVSGKTVPASMHFVTDPGLKTVELYNLRWNAPNETAYPSTFLVDRTGVIRYAKISKQHGDRAGAADVLAEISKLK